MKINRVGEKYKTNEGYEVEIVAYRKANDLDVKFADGNVVRVEFGALKKGQVKNPFHVSVYGLGFHGGTIPNVNIYKYWVSMFIRCYDSSVHEKQPTYAECSIDERWHNFQNYITWYNDNYIEGYQVDKDILVKGNKIYGPDTCCFVPREINVLFTLRNNDRGKYKLGVTRRYRPYIATVNMFGKPVRLGTFKTEDEAFNTYKTEKEKYIKVVANIYKDRIKENVYNALMNYEIE